MFAADSVPYSATKSFSKVVIDYLDGNEKLKPFFSFPPNIDGVRKGLIAKEKHPVDRQLLVSVLYEQYKTVAPGEKVLKNIILLQDEKTFTICTAHQPNLFTGPLYFIYKILHAIKLADDLKKEFEDYNFVPVYYMGCEDADLNELNHFTIRGKKYVWQTKQKGAVGRMKVDKELLQLLDSMQQQIALEPFGEEWVSLLQSAFTAGKDIQTATFELSHQLFAKWGLIVLIPDHPSLKKVATPVFEEDLFEQKPSSIVAATSSRLSQNYNVQAHARDINLFYLKDDIRDRITREERFKVVNTELSFSEEELQQELQIHPERFSPNVILRGLFQEMILPNIVFIGGGGELAYWLQLKDLFQHYSVPFPVQVLRNSFVIIEKAQHDLIKKLELPITEIFNTELEIINQVLEGEGKKPRLNGEVEGLKKIYDELKLMASAIDPSLQEHVEALRTKAVNKLQELEKKLFRAERKKNEAVQRQIHKIKEQLFPNNNLQERVENIGGYYSQWGSEFIDVLYKNSKGLEQDFTVLYQTD